MSNTIHPLDTDTQVEAMLDRIDQEMLKDSPLDADIYQKTKSIKNDIDELYANFGRRLLKMNDLISKERCEKIMLQREIEKLQDTVERLEKQLHKATGDTPHKGFTNYITWSHWYWLDDKLDWLDDENDFDEKEELFYSLSKPDGVIEMLEEHIENDDEFKALCLENGKCSIDFGQIAETIEQKYAEWSEKQANDSEKEEGSEEE